jgi:hypothetical protein
MEFKRLEIVGRGGTPVGHIDLIAADPTRDEYKIVIQLQNGYQVLALRGEMFSGRISGILGKAPVAPDSVPRAASC